MADQQEPIVAAATEERHKSGAGAAIVVALALAVSVAAWQVLGGASMDSGGEGLARVEPEDIAGAMTTMGASRDLLGEFQGDAATCPKALAWVSLARVPGHAGGKVRIHSGSYLSPTFELGDAPHRVAIPYPAPYQLGRGEISVTGVADGLVISLAPSWTIASLNGVATRPVVWHVRPDCES